jgi:hypothetical protein
MVLVLATFFQPVQTAVPLSWMGTDQQRTIGEMAEK